MKVIFCPFRRAQADTLSQFGKQIQAQQVPGWSTYYLDYKTLKKIISSLTANRPASEAAVLASGILPVAPMDLLNQLTDSSLIDTKGQLPIFASSGRDEDRDPDFQAHKAAFFFKLERELEKVNTVAHIDHIYIYRLIILIERSTSSTCRERRH
jgi:CDK inhibitor PHO81